MRLGKFSVHLLSKVSLFSFTLWYAHGGPKKDSPQFKDKEKEAQKNKIIDSQLLCGEIRTSNHSLFLHAYVRGMYMCMHVHMCVGTYVCI